jgi:hypothetical protein
MKRFLAILGVYALVILALPVASQEGAATGAHGIYGHWDPTTGIFKPAHQVPLDNASANGEAMPPTSTYTGKFVVNFTVTISSAIPTGDTIGCNVSVTLVDTAGDTTDSMAVSATRSGSTATCSVTIPYSWQVTSTTDPVYVSYDISAPPQPLVSTSSFPRRYTTHPISKITVPLNGATTTYTITTTI